MKTYNFTIRGNKYSVNIHSFEENIIELEVNGTPYSVELEQKVKTVKTPKLVRPEKIKTEDKKIQDTSDTSKVMAPLPGTILKFTKKEGDAVKKGDVVLIMEAMKMENNILAEVDGTIKSVKVSEGETVLQGDVLFEIE
ncbi:acetyl-CoA carboxylase biotin carboxyl carrier protein subunit [Bacteroidota bacterium]